MDSKMIRNAIITAVCGVIIIILAVVLGNWEEIMARYGLSGSGSTLPSQEQIIAEAADPMAEAPGPATAGKGTQVGSDLSGFMADDAFFNPDPTKASSVRVSYGKTASLVMSSVEKDLKIHIVDILGRNIAGEEFSVSIEDVGEYRDSDKDGVIYVSPMRAGECRVTLNPYSGYQISGESALITIKQKIEYVALNAIDLMILTEDEVDAEKEDTAQKMADDDRDETEQTEALGSWTGAKWGIDVSKWNKEIDWDKVKNAGVEFAIIRVGYRGYTSGALIMDPYFEENMRGAMNAGIPIGVYFFSQAVTPMEAVEEASMVIELCRNYPLQYPVFLDSESTGGGGRADNLSAGQRTELSRAFLETIKGADLTAGIYGARNWFGQRLLMEQLGEYVVWLAEYREVPLYSDYYQMWQYSSRGKVEGIEGNVDLNLSYMD